MVKVVTRFQTSDGKDYKTEEEARIAEDVLLARSMKETLESNANFNLDFKEIDNGFEVLEEIMYFIVNNNLHKSQLRMREFAALLAELHEREETEDE